MYNDMTFEAILSRALSKIDNEIDKSEGSIMYTALAPACAELAQIYIEMDVILNNMFLDTAINDYLTGLCHQHGVLRKEAMKAHRKGEFNTSVQVGSRFRLNDTTYSVIDSISDTFYVLECEQPGRIGNNYSGSMTPIDYIEGLSVAVLSDVLVNGTDEETDDELRKRMKEYIITPAQDGNAAQYKKWAMEFSGIGRAKIIPLWAGGNTVKIAITNSDNQPADSVLVEDFQNYIDPGASGLGNGVAPIGSKVTVVSGTQKDISITANIVLADGYTEPEGAAKAVTDYLASITYEKNSVSYMRIGSTLLDCESITDVNNLMINAGAADILLYGDEVPVLDSLSLVVVN